ncbi:MAG: M90 family metallopeptidase [Burkholderiaceae bacterium]
MPMIVLLMIVLTGGALLFWLPKYRVQRALSHPFPRHYAKILRRNVPVFSRLPADLQLQLKRLMQQFLLQKKFVGCDGQEITDEIKVTIAGKACLLLLNRPTEVYPALSFVLVYPSAFIVPHKEIGAGGLVTHHEQTLLGQSWSDDRVILAWDHVLRDNTDIEPGHDVVLHEFAHQLDSEDGSVNGAPVMLSKARYTRWSTVLSHEFELLQRAVHHQHHGVIDHYGASNPAEFFAVVTEAFFKKSVALSEEHPALFAAFSEYYCVDPREWV